MTYKGSVGLGKLNYRAHVFERDGQFYLVITLTRDGGSTWASKPGWLEGAASWDEANKQAVEQVTALHRALRSE